jgi:hypothetical protein
MNPTQLFLSAVNNGLKTANAIVDPAQKAQTYAAIAQALALSGLVSKADQIESKGEEESKSSKGKESLKHTPAKKKEETVPEAPAQEPAADTPAEPELSEEWTEEMMELKAEPLARFAQIREE